MRDACEVKNSTAKFLHPFTVTVARPGRRHPTAHLPDDGAPTRMRKIIALTPFRRVVAPPRSAHEYCSTVVASTLYGCAFNGRTHEPDAFELGAQRPGAQFHASATGTFRHSAAVTPLGDYIHHRSLPWQPRHNQLLAALPAADYECIQRALEPIDMPSGMSCAKPDSAPSTRTFRLPEWYRSCIELRERRDGPKSPPRAMTALSASRSCSVAAAQTDAGGGAGRQPWVRVAGRRVAAKCAAAKRAVRAVALCPGVAHGR